MASPTAEPPERPRQPHSWVELLAASALVVYFLATVLAGGFEKSKTMDEQTHFASGLAFLDGRPARIVEADGTMPVSALNVVSLRAARRLFGEPVPIGAIFWMRLPTALLGVLVLVAGWRLGRRCWGPTGGLVSLALLALDPNLIAHSKWVTTDAAAALGFVLTIAALAAYLDRASWQRGAAVAAALAVANLFKITNLLLFPIAALVLYSDLALRWPQLEPARRRRRAIAPACVVLAGLVCTLAALWAVFPRGLEPGVPRLEERGWSRSVSEIVPPGYAATVASAIDHNRRGHPAYLMGHHSVHGWPHYYLIALLVKTPLPTLVLALGSLAAAATGLRRWRRAELALLLPLVCFVGYASIFVHVNTGIRHVLAVVPIVGVLAAGLVTAEGRARRWARPTVMLLVGAQALELALVFPHHLSYFNQIAGGSRNGWRWLADSNLDWGQDDLFLARWREAHPELVVNPPEPTSGLVTMDVNRLVGLTDDQARTAAWLREGHTPELWVTPVWPVYRIAPTGDEDGPGGSHSTKRAGPGSGR